MADRHHAESTVVAAADGTATLTLQAPPIGSTLTGSICVPTADSNAIFSIVIGGTTWGAWTGNATFGPVQQWAGEPIVVTAIGLAAGVSYSLVFIGMVEAEQSTQIIWPSALSSATAGSIVQIVGTLNATLDGSDTRQAAINGNATLTGLGVGNNRAPIVLNAGIAAYINDTAHDYNLAVLLNNYTADGAALSIGNWAAGDGIYVQTTDNSQASVIPPIAINVFAGTGAQVTTESGSGGTVTYGTTTLTDTSKAWAANQWVGIYVLVGATRMYVTGNSATQLVGTGWTQTEPTGGVGQIPAATPANGTAYSIPRPNGTGINIERFGTGNSLKFITYSGSGQANNQTGAIININQLAGADSSTIYSTDAGAVTSNIINVSATALTSGGFINFFHATSTMAGAVLKANVGNGGGAFTGAFLEFDVNGARVFSIAAAGQIQTAALNEATGAGAAALGANCPAVTPGAPYQWLRFATSDGSTVYVPAWK